MTVDLYFTDDFMNYRIRIKNYEGWIFEHKTNTLKININNKLFIFYNVKFETIKTRKIFK